MRRDARFPSGQAEVVFSDVLIEQLGMHIPSERESVIAEVVRLCDRPGGKHPLRAPLAGWNTVDVLAGHRRIVYKASVVQGVGRLEALCLGPRSDNEVYDMAVALVESGLLTDDEVSSIWDALAILAVIEEDVGLDGWDYLPPPAPEGVVSSRAAPRCEEMLPRAQAACVRRRGHPGPHRSTP